MRDVFLDLRVTLGTPKLKKKIHAVRFFIRLRKKAGYIFRVYVCIKRLVAFLGEYCQWICLKRRSDTRQIKIKKKQNIKSYSQSVFLNNIITRYLVSITHYLFTKTSFINSLSLYYLYLLSYPINCPVFLVTNH